MHDRPRGHTSAASAAQGVRDARRMWPSSNAPGNVASARFCTPERGVLGDRASRSRETRRWQPVSKSRSCLKRARSIEDTFSITAMRHVRACSSDLQRRACAVRPGVLSVFVLGRRRLCGITKTGESSKVLTHKRANGRRLCGNKYFQRQGSPKRNRALTPSSSVQAGIRHQHSAKHKRVIIRRAPSSSTQVAIRHSTKRP